MGYLGTKPQIATTLADNIVTADKIVSGAVTDAKIAAMAATKLTGQVPDTNAPSGSVIQVVQTNKTSNFSTSSGSYVDITGYSATITPSSASSKILVISNFFAGGSSAEYPKFKLLRDSTDIFLGDAYGSATRQSAGMYPGTQASTQILSVATCYLDSPATTSAVTYKWQVFTFSGRTIYIGSTPGSSDGNNSSVPSTITLMEIAV